MKETAEERINHLLRFNTENEKIQFGPLFEAGAQWEKERSYSEEEVKAMIEDWTKMKTGLNLNLPRDKFDQWFNQHKK